MELLGILALPGAVGAIDLMQEHGVLPVILPEVRERERMLFAALVGHETDMGVEGDPVRRLAALLPPIASVAEAVSARLRLSRAQRARLVCAAERKDSDAEAPRALAYAEGIDCARDRLLIAGAAIGDLENWTVPELPFKGGEIVQRGVGAGPDVARVLRAVEARWIAEQFPSRDRVLELLDEELAAL